LLADLTTEQNRTKAMAAVGGSIGLTFALAMIFGPALASSGGLRLVFWVTAGLAVLGILVVTRLPSPGIASRVASREALTVPGLIRSTLANGELLRLDAGIFVLHSVQMASWMAVPMILDQVLGFPRSSHWWLYLLSMGGGFVAMLPFIILAERKRQLKAVFLGAIGLLGVAQIVLMAGSNVFSGFAFGLFLFFMAFNLLEATLPSLVSKIAPVGCRGTAMGVYSSSQFLGSFVGGVAGGWLAQVSSLPAIFEYCALMAGLWFLIALTMARPRHWTSIVVELKADAPPLNPSSFTGLAGVEDVVLMAEQGLAYFKVDKKQLDAQAFDDALKVFRRTNIAG